jgi:hypothetical protein
MLPNPRRFRFREFTFATTVDNGSVGKSPADIGLAQIGWQWRKRRSVAYFVVAALHAFGSMRNRTLYCTY